MFLTITAIFFATLNAIVSGYYLTQSLDKPETRAGSLIFACVAALTALVLYTVAKLS